MSTSDNLKTVNQTTPRPIKPRQLLKRLYEADNPALATQQLAPYQLYALLLNVGFSEAPEIMALASREQLARIVDLHCWAGTELVEAQLWELFSTTDATDSLDLLQKIIASMDLKVLAYLISKYVTTTIFDEPTEQPPGDGYFTPDQGYTWVKVDDSDETAYFQLNRALALIFESNPAIFYQLIALPSLHTSSSLEEEALLERIRNIESLGFPSADFCEELNTPLPHASVVAKFKLQTAEATSRVNIDDQTPTSANNYRHLNTLRSQATNTEEFNDELQLLINAAILHWQVPFFEPDRLRVMTEGVLASLELGLAFFNSGTTQAKVIQAFEQNGLKLFYRTGLGQLRQVSKASWKIRSQIQLTDLTWEKSQLLEALCQPIPCLPTWWTPNWVATPENTTTPPYTFEVRQFNTLGELEIILEALPKYTLYR